MTDTQATSFPALLEARNLSARYGHVEALHGANIEVGEGEFVAVLGPNGAGKTTLLRALMRLVPSSGQVSFAGTEMRRLKTDERARRGMIMVQEGRGLFSQMTVRENLLLGAYNAGGDRAEIGRRFDQVYALFPRLCERAQQAAGSMSGGEQQMLAIGRAMMARPKLLLLDEPSLGLAPKIAAEIFATLRTLNQAGLTILIVEQKAPLALELADRIYVLVVGRIVAALGASEIQSHHDLARYYFA